MPRRTRFRPGPKPRDTRSMRSTAPMVPGGDGFEHLTFRQLIASKALARRRMRLGGSDAGAMYRRIEKELESRRKLTWRNIRSDLPDIDALDEQANEESEYLRPFGQL